MNWNKVELAGHTTRDIELRYLPKGTCVGDFSLAVNRRWKDDSGEQKEEVSFINCVAFGKTAETLAQYVKKGHPLFIAGRLRQETWQDKTTGQNRQAIKVIVGEFQFLAKATGNGTAAPRATAPAAGQGAEEPQPDADAGGYQPGDDGVPF